MFSNADQNFLISFPQPPHLASEGERTSRVYARVQVVRTRGHLRMLANFVGIARKRKQMGFPSFWKARLSSLVRNVKQNKEDKEGNKK